MAKIHPVHKGRIIELCLEDVTLPNGVNLTLEIIHHPGAAAVVAVDEVGEVALIRQFRHAAGGFIWEIPAGTLHDGENPRHCAERELEEETGLRAREFIALGPIVTTPGFCDETIHLYLARGLTLTAQRLEHDEVLSVVRLPLQRALDMVATSEIQDAKTIAGLHKAAVYLAAARRSAD